MKRAWTILIAGALALSLTACGGAPVAGGAAEAVSANNQENSLAQSAVQETAPDVGCSMTTEWPEYAPGVEAVTVLLENQSEQAWETGADFHVEVDLGKNGSPSWYRLEPADGEGVSFIAIAYGVEPHDTLALSCYLPGYDFSRFPEGHFRMVKTISRQEKGVWVRENLAAEFTISADAPITPERPYGFAPLEELPQDYTAELAAADGCVVFPNDGEPVNREAVDAFLKKAALEIPCQLRVARPTAEGAIVLEDIVYENFNGVSGGRYLWRRDDSRDGSSASPGIDPASIWSFLTADRRGIALSSSIDSSHAYGVPDLVVLFNSEVTIEQTEAVAAMDDALMESNSTRFRVWSAGGTQWAALTDEPLEFAYGGEGHGETHSLADYDGMDEEILGISWADDHTLSLVVGQVKGLPDGKPIVIYLYDTASNTLTATDLTYCVPSYVDPRDW